MPLQLGLAQDVRAQQSREKADVKRRDKVRRRKLRALGFEDEGEVLH